MKLGILTSFNKEHVLYEQACKYLKIDYEIIDFLSSNWLYNINKSDVDGFLCTSTCDIIERKAIIDERHYVIEHVLKRSIYPKFMELYIHENKRNMAAWLDANNFPHIETKVFVKKKEATDYLNKVNYPLVFKANVGAGGSKVRIIKNKLQAKWFVFQVFPISDKIIRFNLGKVFFNKKFGLKLFPDLANTQKFYLLVQEFKPIKHEWRIIRLGDSFFGHQKLLKDHLASGSGKVGWEKPPKELLELTRKLCDKGGFRSMAVDIFETKENEYFINEIQTMFGSVDDSQMYIDGVAYRYIWNGNDFVLEEGKFNQFGSRLLRVKDFVTLLKRKKIEEETK